MNTRQANDAKASFDDIYTKPDPRDYYSVLGSLDYSIPDLAKPIFRQVATAWRRQTGKNASILDLGSSYGINAALFRYPLSFAMLRRRYARRAMLNLPSDQLQALDHNYFGAWPRAHEERLVVADLSAPAIEYALKAGLADAGIAGSLEEGAPPIPKRNGRSPMSISWSRRGASATSPKRLSRPYSAPRESRPGWFHSCCACSTTPRSPIRSRARA